MMKGKKEYVVLIVVIALLGAYLAFKRTDRVHYQVPQLSAVDGKNITRIEITGKDRAIELNKKDSGWVIGPKEYQADAARVEKMLKPISDLTLTDLVSESKNYTRYELGEQGKITVKAYAGAKLSRHFDIGKAAQSAKHTFVMLPDDPRVYQAKDSFREYFQVGMNELRNRQVLTFAEDGIRKLSIVKGGKPFTLTRQEPAAPAGKPEAAAPGGQAVWKDETGREIAKTDVDMLLSSLSKLECGEFLDDAAREGLGTPEVIITLTGSQDYSLSLYAAQGEKAPASSSASPYVFTLPDYRKEGILKNLDTLLNRK